MPPVSGFRLVRYFAVASLAAFLPVAAAVLYFESRDGDLFSRLQQEREALLARMQESIMQRHEAGAHGDLLSVHEAGNINLVWLFANTLWERDFAPFVAKAQQIPADQCRAIADIKDASGNTVASGEKKACFSELGKKIMALPDFRALDARVFDLVKKSSVLKIKVYDLRGITVYSSEHSQIGEDKRDNAGWKSAVAGKPASELTHRGKFTAFEGEVADRDLVASYLPVMTRGRDRTAAVFEIYSDVTPFLAQIKTTAADIRKLSAENQAFLDRAAIANRKELDANANLMLAIILGLLTVLYLSLFLIVRNGQHIIDKQNLERTKQAQRIARLSRVRAVMSAINSLIVRVRERQELFDAACRIAVEEGNFGMAWVSEFDPKTLDVTPIAHAGTGTGDFVNSKSTVRADTPLGQGVVGRAIRAKDLSFVNDLTAEPAVGSAKRAEAIRRGYRSLIALPLFKEGAIFGALTLYAKEPNFFNEDELKVLRELAGDISFALDHIAKEEKLNYLAYYDALTGLPNRTLFDDRMAQRLRTASHEKNKVAVVLLDLERFHSINETLGRSAADELLKLVAQRLQSAIFDRDSAARVHANVFATLFTAIKDEADVARIVEEKIMGCLNEPFTIGGQEVQVSAKAGVALFPSDATQPDALFSCAEAALRQAKDSSERYLFYAPKMNAEVAERLKLENKLQRALKQEEFVLFYQPKVDFHTGGITGVEALMRWNDPESGLVAPMRFIPVLEETGMIVEVGAWAMKQAVSQHAAWRAAGLPALPIAVNVSQVQLRRKDFVAIVQQAIAMAGNSGHGLDLEITESMIMEDIESSIEKLKTIRELGVGVSLDDFGTGYSSLRYLSRLPVTALKIDRSFLQHMTTNPDDMAIVSTVIALGHNLMLKVIAEGVETEEQRSFLRLLKCDEFQGYLFSKPVPQVEVPALLARGGK